MAGRMPEVDPQEAQQLVADGALLLDVREDKEWDAGHAPEASHVPLGRLAGAAERLDAQRRIVAVCRSGSRSAQATLALRHAGYDVVNLTGGMQAWTRSGLPVVRDDGAPGTVA